MICPPAQMSSDSIERLLSSVRAKGAYLWIADGRLHYRAEKGVLTGEELDSLRRFKDQVIALLQRPPGVERLDGPQELQGLSYRAPLSFSQLAHWNFYRLAERRSIRQIASATRIAGRLHVDALRKSFQVLLRRHEALRTRVIVVDEAPVQEISDSGNLTLTVEDLPAVSLSDADSKLQPLIEQFIREPVDLAVDPLFKVRLLQLGPDEHVLIIGLEHIVSDGSSLSILMRDLFTTYVQVLRGGPTCLPPIRVKFTDFCRRQRNAQESWWASHGVYWTQRLAGAHRLRFPEDSSARIANRVGRATVPFRVGKGLKAQLHDWSRRRRTTLVLSILTAYVGLIMRWCNVSDIVLQYVVNGRDGPDLQNTIGYFASPLYLRIVLHEQDTFIDLLGRVMEEYCQACEHADSSYLAAQLPIPPYVRNTIFNWLSYGSSQIDVGNLLGSPDELRCSAIRFANPEPSDFEIDREPFVLLWDTDEEIAGDVYFPLNRFSVGTMEWFKFNFLVFIEALVRQSHSRIKDIPIADST